MESGIPNGRPMILIAEDSPTQSAHLIHLLERHRYPVTAARNGREALELLEQVKPALVITDVVMPELDGYGLCSAIKANDEWKDIPVMLVTTLADPRDVIRGLECGADNFIRKPYEEKYLMSRIDYLLMNESIRRNQKMRIGVEIHLGKQRHFITSDRQQILDLLISTYEQAVQINDDLKEREKDLAHANEVLNGLYRIADGLNQARSEQAVVDLALERLLELPSFESGWILLRRDGAMKLAAGRNLPPGLQQTEALEGDCVCQRLLRSGELVSATNVPECDLLLDAAGTFDPRAHAAVPIRLGEETVGLMNLVGSDPQSFEDEELKILQNVANQVAVALDRTRMHEHLEGLVEARTEESRRLTESLTNTLESITDAFMTLDREWRFTYVNRQAEQLLRKSQKDLLGRNVWNEFSEARGSTFEREYRRAVEQNVPVAFEEYYEPLDLWVEIRAYPSPQGLTIYARDVTEQRRARESMRSSEVRFRTLTEAMPQMVWIARPDGANIYSNQRWVDYTGLSVEESFGLGWFIALHPDDRTAALEATRAGHAEVNEQVRIRSSDGTYRWWLLRAVPLTDGSGRITEWMGTCTDIQDLRQAVEQIAEQAALIDQAHDAIAVRNLDGRITFWSRGAERLYGWLAVEALGRKFDELLHVDKTRFAAATAEVLRTGAWNGEFQKATASGNQVTVDSRWTLLQDEAGRPRSVLSLDTDITERKKTEIQLQESEERYRLLFDRNPHPMWVYDNETLAFLAINDAALEHYGYSREEFLGMTILDIRPPEDVPVVMRDLEEQPDTDVPKVHGVFRHRMKSGAIVEMEIASSQIAFGERPAALVLAVDVTERRRIEQQFLRAQRMESIGTLAGGIAHDLNNLLMPIMMGVSLLRRTVPDERSVRTLDNIERSAKRGRDLVRQVLSFARGIEGARVPVHLGDVVREVESIVGSTFPKNVSIEVDVPSDLWSIDGDPTQLNQLFLNLCVNARDAMPTGGRLRISAWNVDIDEQYASMHQGIAPGQYVLMEVQDEGLGMSSEVIEHIFEPFFTTKDVGQGTGLGLSTVSAIVKSHGGFIGVQSDVGKGSVFKVHFPARQQTESVATEGAISSAALLRGNDELILVVDDEASILAITRQTLEAFGYRVMTAEDGAQATAQFATHRDEIAAVITDMMMPVMDGPALIRVLQRMQPDLAIIASSGLDANTNAMQAVHAGVRNFLHKPYTAEVLLRTLRSALDEK